MFSFIGKIKTWFVNAFCAVIGWISHFFGSIKRKFYRPKTLPKPSKVNVIPIAPANSANLPKIVGKSDGKVQFLKIISWDLMIESNGQAHNTSLFDLMNRTGADSRLVVRRGQEFFIKLNLDRDYDPKIDGISLVFTLEGIEKPQHGNGTFVIVPVLNVGEDAEGSWRSTLYSKEVNSIVVKIVPPVNAIVGKWKVDIDVKKKDRTGATSFTTHQPIYILFNPWCSEDSVYIPDDEKRQEYVMQDMGYIYRGTHRQVLPSMWKYGQFKENMLDCALHLMTKVGKVRSSSRNDPIIVSRVLSGVINSDGKDNKVIISNWTNDFNGGTSPTHWMGSFAILKKYYETKQPVKYGQCWVLSGVYTTLCRALGIPSRVVTNYSSARDAEGSVTVDYIVDAEGKAVEDINSDSIWTFHTWNEVWMQRLDLGAEYSGWQAIDASLSSKTGEGSNRCGPASIVAIKKGEVRRAYNGESLYGEVNADQIIWKYNGATVPLTLIRKDTTSVGKQIVTKPIGIKEQPEILTDNYKYPEESQEERKSMSKALNKHDWIFSRFSMNKEFRDIKFDFKLNDDVVIGSPFNVGLVMENLNSEVEYRVSIILRVDSILYTGKMSQPIKYLATECIVKPGTIEEVNLCLAWVEYAPRLQNQCAFNVACLAKVHEVNYEYFAQDFFQLLKPKITTVISKKYSELNRVDKVSSFVNPLPVPLHNGEFIIDVPFLNTELKMKVNKPIMPGEKVSCTYWVKEYGNANMFKTSIKFHSKELDDVEGYHYSAISVENGTH
ncbi:annulin-like [Chelonus insularis]|uniref:annulin-like n=1 Tax=Chelonus insularis TaxID=460826 RepID=UPI00158F1492|nr:annulin-like [Chelonus insularis]